MLSLYRARFSDPSDDGNISTGDISERKNHTTAREGPAGLSYLAAVGGSIV
jgi:hypothetical protein